ncbi:MAG TPA: MBL fold metallo-hydrolase [Longimicrobiales bacterium]
MLLRTLYDDKLAQASYLIGCQSTGQALIIDPNRDAQQYVRAARREGLRITHVAETHIHADFVSGSRELAHATGATMCLSAEGGRDWQYAFADQPNVVLLRDGDVFRIGNIRVQVMHTPGHTPEHICFLITDTSSAEQPMGICSGDFVFVGDVGRPDLLEKAAGVAGAMQEGAQQLYQSLERFRELPDYLQVWPGHGAGSACGKALGAVPQTTVGYEKLFSPAFAFSTEPEFVDYILSGQPEPPRYFATMKRINREGPPIAGGLRVPPEIVDAQELLRILREGMTVVDTRDARAFGRGHVHGVINIPYNRAFTTWAGSLLSYDAPFALIAEERVIAEMARDLALIGLDDVAGYVALSRIAPFATETLSSIDTDHMNELVGRADAVVLDVRGLAEWQEGHVPGARHIPIGEITERSDELPRSKRIVVHCQTGSRAAIASSVLQARGFDVVNVHGGFEQWRASGRPIEWVAAADALVER